MLSLTVKAEIDQTILDRNEARRKLFQLLQEFINLFSDVDALTSREAQIEVNSDFFLVMAKDFKRQ